MNTLILLKISLGMTTFLWITISKIALIDAKDISNMGNVYIKAIYTGDTCIKNINTKSTYTRDFWIIGAFIKASCSKVTYIRDV